MEIILKRIFLVLILMAGPAFSAEMDLNGATFDAWRVACASNEDCVLEQELLRVSDNTSLIRAAAIKTLERGPSLMVSVPWGVYLPHGVVMQIDGRKGRRMGFETCNPAGCHLAVPLEGAVLKELQRGLALKIQYSDVTQQPLVLELSLIGFSAGYEALN